MAHTSWCHFQDTTSPLNGNLSPRDKHNHKDGHKKEDRMSPRSDASSHGSASSSKPKEVLSKLLSSFHACNLYEHSCPFNAGGLERSDMKYKYFTSVQFD